MSSLKQSKDQERASSAWENVKQVDKNHRDTLGRKYNSLARSAPAMVQSNGLGQTLAFFRAKAGPSRSGEHGLLYNHLSQWVLAELKVTDSQDLLDWVVQKDTQSYRRATAETLAYLSWLKRFAEAVLPEAAANED